MTPLRFAIHAHVYYRELWPELATCIRNFADYEHNLFITTPRRQCRARHPDLHLGRNRATVRRLFLKYQLVVKR